MPIINQVVKGGGSSTKHGLSINNIVGDVNQNGELQRPSGESSVSFSGFTSVGWGALAYKLQYNSTITSLDASNITQIAQPNGCAGMLYGCTVLTTLNMSGLVGFTGTAALNQNGGAYQMCAGCSALATVVMTSLSVVPSNAMASCFFMCSNLTTLALPALTQLDDNAFYQMFAFSGITQLTLGGTSAIVINGNPFSFMFSACSQNITVYAPAANQNDIEALSGYPNFNGSGTVTWVWQS